MRVLLGFCGVINMFSKAALERFRDARRMRIRLDLGLLDLLWKPREKPGAAFLRPLRGKHGASFF